MDPQRLDQTWQTEIQTDTNTLLYGTGVSLLTQLLYAVVFVTRYLDLLNPDTWSVRTYGGAVIWNVSFKLFFITSAFYTIFIMMKVFPRTRERERAWKLGIYSVLASIVLSPLSIVILEKGFPSHWFLEVSNGQIPSAVHCELLWLLRKSKLLTRDLWSPALLGLLHRPRVRLRPPAASTPPTNHSPHRN